jgi:hypothetical protein
MFPEENLGWGSLLKDPASEMLSHFKTWCPRGAPPSTRSLVPLQSSL